MKFAAIVLVTPLALFAQSYSVSTTDSLTSQALKPGSPAGSYALTGLDTMDLYSGNANISIPLLQVGGRGEAGYTIQANVTKRPWEVTSFIPDSTTNDCAAGADCYGYAIGGGPTSTLDIRYKPAVIIARYAAVTNYIPNCPGDSGPLLVTPGTVTRLTVVMVDGSEVDLSDQGTLAEIDTAGGGCTNPQPPAFDRGTTFVSTDGSGLTFIASSAIYDQTTASNYGPVSGTLYFPDGRQIAMTNGYPKSITDRNGNLTTIDYDLTCTSQMPPLNPGCTIVDSYPNGLPPLDFTITDPVGRATYVEICNPALSGGGVSVDTILAPTGQTVEVFSQAYSNSGVCWNCGGTAPPISSLFNVCGTTEPALLYQGIYQIQIPSGSATPNTYNFLYNQYAEIVRMTLESGPGCQDHFSPAISYGSARLI